MLKAALNGDREPKSHPALPIDPHQLAADAAACVSAGAGAVHIHPRGPDGLETLDPSVIDETLRTVRRKGNVDVPIGVSTGAWIEPDPERRAAAIAQWREPDMASVNLSEEGAEMIMAALESAGIGIEAGVWSVPDAEKLKASGFADRLVRVLIEIVNPTANPEGEARDIDAALDRLGIGAPRLHHGEDAATWPVLRQAERLGWDMRIGLEDTLLLPDGSRAASNEELVKVALSL
jgi:uncharacterized protein (DUF849 family)